jgi:hypothetical protein
VQGKHAGMILTAPREAVWTTQACGPYRGCCTAVSCCSDVSERNIAYLFYFNIQINPRSRFETLLKKKKKSHSIIFSSSKTLQKKLKNFSKALYNCCLNSKKKKQDCSSSCMDVVPEDDTS